MARFRLGDVNTWINNIKSEVAAQAAEDIVRQLKIRGPYWTGEFEGAWDVVLGSGTIAANKQSSVDRDQALREGPGPREVTPLRAGVDFPVPAKGAEAQYTIDNRMVYRDVAKDLVPGRIKNGNRETAQQDWYRTYVEGGGLATTLALSTGRVSRDPQIRNFKGRVSK